MSWGAVAGAAVTAVGGYISSKNNKKANSSSQGAYDQAYLANTRNLQPYMDAGTGALNQLAQLNSGNYSSFNESPDYQWTQQQGLQALDRSAAARGSLYSGGQTADVLKYSQGLASQQYNNYYNKIAGLAGLGQSAASALTGVNNNYANQTAATAQNNASNSNALVGLLSGVGSSLLGSYGSNARQSSYGGGNNLSSLYNMQSNTGQGSAYNFGNNLYNFAGRTYG